MLAPIPTRFWVKGDVVYGKTLIGLARRHMNRERERIALNKFSKYAQDLPSIPVMRLLDGTTIHVEINHGISNIYINTLVRRGHDGNDDLFYNLCFCNTHFAVCRVINREDYSEGVIKDNVRYTLEVCNKTHKPCIGACDYIMYENMLLTDFTEVVPDSETVGDEAGFISFGLVVISSSDESMTTNTPITTAYSPTTTTESPSDAPVYRVLPLQDPLIKKWIEKGVEHVN